MSAAENFRKSFCKKHLSDIYRNEIQYKSASGIDRVSSRAFKTRYKQELEIIYRKAHNGTHRFSQYREKLLSRGAERYPRVISIPTMRDKITQKALAEILHLEFGTNISLLHEVIGKAITAYRSGLYASVLRLDVRDFYPSIIHRILLKEIRKKIRKREILHLINDTISQKTVAQPSSRDKQFINKGVPQGLSVSNILANIYMLPIDDKYLNISAIEYFRYVDDILIFCAAKDLPSLRIQISKDCQDRGLSLHSESEIPSKSSMGKMADEFSYLGYKFKNQFVSVRKKSVDHLRESILSLLTAYKYSEPQNMELLQWGLNLRITGCVFNHTKYGWLFYFSQIDDLALLGSLDHFVKTQLQRFAVNQFKTKSFLKAYHEITRNLSATTYIPNFDRMPISEKHQILIQVFKFPTEHISANEIEYHFRKKIYKTVRDLEKDLAQLS